MRLIWLSLLLNFRLVIHLCLILSLLCSLILPSSPRRMQKPMSLFSVLKKLLRVFLLMLNNLLIMTVVNGLRLLALLNGLKRWALLNLFPLKLRCFLLSDFFRPGTIVQFFNPNDGETYDGVISRVVFEDETDISLVIRYVDIV